MASICLGLNVLILFVASLMQSHYLNQCWNNVNWILVNKSQWNWNQNTQIATAKWQPFFPGLNVLIMSLKLVNEDVSKLIYWRVAMIWQKWNGTSMVVSTMANRWHAPFGTMFAERLWSCIIDANGKLMPRHPSRYRNTGSLLHWGRRFKSLLAQHWRQATEIDNFINNLIVIPTLRKVFEAGMTSLSFYPNTTTYMIS